MTSETYIVGLYDQAGNPITGSAESGSSPTVALREFLRHRPTQAVLRSAVREGGATIRIRIR